ncbi:class E sortase [Streptomyces sp. A3M-1-3]|uniref:class E sortase n=1 Tax=Streptomyces sp. A3M-1-3 TaxID=2962044 RepID=UPI0020B74495|nr:class E sortase [Streptomyces sp. A3M-1-3]MCP3819498.1 class E sortase [Streptomyces sp. A3M-1-3]
MAVVVQGAGRRRAVLARGLWAGGEVAVTLGVVLLLLVVHQLWWTNREAREGAERQVQALEREWEQPPEDRPAEEGPRGEVPEELVAVPEGPVAEESERAVARPKPRAPRWDQAYAVLRIPRLGVAAPVAQGVGKRGVLDKGYVGHYPGTAQPGQAGNFAVAGHRNTHGEPFRYINRLRVGDELRVETRVGRFTYVVDRTLEQTSARDGGVIAPVPRSVVKPAYGYRKLGYYITLTTCTPEFSSKYRLVVWGKLKSVERR